jgi:hypothetical protein
VAPAEPWLDVDAVHAWLLQRAPRGPEDCRRAADRYAQLVADDTAPSPWEDGLRQQVFLGDEAFVEKTLAQATPAARASREVPLQHRLKRPPPRELSDFLSLTGDRDSALYAAYREGGMTMTQLARESALSVSRVSRLIAKLEGTATVRGARGKT